MSGPRLHPAPPRGCPGSVPPATSLSPQCFCGSASVLRRGSGAGCRGARRRWGAPGGRHTGRGAGVHRLPSRGLTERALRVLGLVFSYHSGFVSSSARGFRRKAQGGGGHRPYLDAAPPLLWARLTFPPAACNVPSGLGIKLYLLCFFPLLILCFNFSGYFA